MSTAPALGDGTATGLGSACDEPFAEALGNSLTFLIPSEKVR